MKTKEELKTYVITLSPRFMKGHPRAGQPTYFKEQFLAKKKIHTIRGNYELWKRRIDDVRDRKAIISIREWSGVPYKSKQIEIAKITSVSCCGIQRIVMLKLDVEQIYWNVDGRRTREQLSEVAANDGLNVEDFRRWFFPDKEKEKVYNAAIIHFTPFRY